MGNVVSPNNRIEYLDSIKSVLIFTVIWGHFIAGTNNVEGQNNSKFIIIYSFHMPLFMALSGIFFYKLFDRDFKKVVWNKILQLIIPATFVLLILTIAISLYKPRNLANLLEWVWSARPWFLFTLFFCIIASLLFTKLTKSPTSGFILTFCLFALIPDVTDKELFMLPFFALGYYAYKYRHFIDKYWMILCLLSIVFWMCIYIGYYNTGNYNVYENPWVLWRVGSGICSPASFKVAVVRYAIGLFVCVFVFIILKKLYETNIGRAINRLKLNKLIGQNTLGIYLLQAVFFSLLTAFSAKYDVFSNISYGRDIIPFILTIVMLPVFNLMVEFIKGNKLLSLLLLGIHNKADVNIKSNKELSDAR